MVADKLTHYLIHMSQVLQRHGLERHLDQTPCKELDRLSAVLPVANIAAFNSDHLPNCAEDGCFKVCIWGQTDGYYRAAGPHVGCGLLEWLL